MITLPHRKNSETTNMARMTNERYSYPRRGLWVVGRNDWTYQNPSYRSIIDRCATLFAMRSHNYKCGDFQSMILIANIFRKEWYHDNIR